MWNLITVSNRFNALDISVWYQPMVMFFCFFLEATKLLFSKVWCCLRETALSRGGVSSCVVEYVFKNVSCHKELILAVLVLEVKNCPSFRITVGVLPNLFWCWRAGWYQGAVIFGVSAGFQQVWNSVKPTKTFSQFWGFGWEV